MTIVLGCWHSRAARYIEPWCEAKGGVVVFPTLHRTLHHCDMRTWQRHGYGRVLLDVRAHLECQISTNIYVVPPYYDHSTRVLA